MEHVHSSDELTFRELHTLGRMDVLSTTEVGCVLQISTNQASKLLDEGTIPGKWNTPGTGRFRRIDRNMLLQYLRNTGNPRADVLDPVTIELVCKTNGNSNGTAQCADGFTLGMTLASRPVRKINLHHDAMTPEAITKLTERITKRFADVQLDPPPMNVMPS
ncbi:hypothetical protein FJZ27_00235 [Candidatus Peribacteria bacterium]|nr:hypothetical protein [Candidatus Peribacteria bacterium]